jgi:CheY-like chemotaxis protein
MNILLVEDNPADMRLLKDFFAEAVHPPAMHWVTDGYEALDYISQRNGYEAAIQPDIILLDLGLPRINGYQVLKDLKSDPKYSHIPIVILTTSRNPLDRSQCDAMGADMFLSKPRSLKDYEAMLDKLLKVDAPRLAHSA